MTIHLKGHMLNWHEWPTYCIHLKNPTGWIHSSSTKVDRKQSTWIIWYMSDILWSHYPVTPLWDWIANQLTNKQTLAAVWNGCIISRRPLDNAAVCSLPRQGSSPRGAVVGASFNQSQINYFTDPKSFDSINWWLTDLRLSTELSCGRQH